MVILYQNNNHYANKIDLTLSHYANKIDLTLSHTLVTDWEKKNKKAWVPCLESQAILVLFHHSPPKNSGHAANQNRFGSF
jgi:hypothetical protein